MARLLEDLELGTPVFLGESRVGDVRGVYAEGEARLAEYITVHWADRGEVLLIPTKDVAALEAKGVVLMLDDPRAYASFPAFDESKHPTIRRLR
jgi:hypothetical protein